MPDFHDVLFVTDFDRTLTGPDGTIPPSNLQAIDFFIAHGGSFTLCTGRSLPLFRPMAKAVPMNAPAILFNGACCYDFAAKTSLFETPIPLDGRVLAADLMVQFPAALLEVQQMQSHYCLGHNEHLTAFCAASGCPLAPMDADEVPRTMMKLAMYQDFRSPDVAQLFEITPPEEAIFSGMVDYLLQTYPGVVSAVRSAPRVVDIQAAQATKGQAASRLAKQLGKTVLAAAGDSENDLTMLRAAQFAFVPSDAGIPADGFTTVAPSGQGSIADAVERLSSRF